MNRNLIREFTNLLVWQEGHRLVIDLYEITKQFPKNEQFVLVTQLRRAAVSVTSNIAEGCSRDTKKAIYQYYLISLGSLYEIENQLMIARDLKYITPSDFEKIIQRLIAVRRLLKGCIRGLNRISI